MESYNVFYVELNIFCQAGEKLGKYDIEKRQAVENEDYDRAKVKKLKMDEYRLQVYKDLDIASLINISSVSFKFFL